MAQAEAWLRGAVEGVDARISPILYSFEQAREDLAAATEGLTDGQLWAEPHGLASAGFHLRHIAGSTDRLMTYLEGRQLSQPQLAALAAESASGGPGREELLAELHRVFAAAERVVRALNRETLTEPRAVGRKRLPTTVAGLLTHIAEHTQRHVGQTISAAKLARRAVGTPPLPG